MNMQIIQTVSVAKNSLINWLENVVKMLMKKKFIQQNYIQKKQFSCKIYIMLFSLFFTTNIGIGTVFTDYKYMNYDKKNFAKEGSIPQTSIY